MNVTHIHTLLIFIIYYIIHIVIKEHDYKITPLL